MSEASHVRRCSYLVVSQLRAMTGMLHWRLLQTLLVVVLTLVPLKAFPQSCNVTGDIPFALSIPQCMNNDFAVCVFCKGPAFRVSPRFLRGSEDPSTCAPCHFYAADIKHSLFSPLGQWTCDLYIAFGTGDGAICGDEEDAFGPVHQTVFCQGDQPFGDYGVDLKVTVGAEAFDWSQYRLEISGNSISPPPCSASVSSVLGDHPDQSGATPDLDTFLFQGAAGDQVTVRLEADPRAGHNGGTASLRVRDESSGQSRTTVGTLPLEGTGTLPTTGRYEVEVGQPAVPNPFRGSYILRIKPIAGSIDRLEPAANVEK